MKFTEEEYRIRRENYFMLLTSLNTVTLCIANINADTLCDKQKKNFLKMRAQTKTFVENIYGKGNKVKKDVMQDLVFENVAVITEVFALMSKIPPEELEWFLEETKKLGYVAFNRSTMFK
jgi:hypothetical protein